MRLLIVSKTVRRNIASYMSGEVGKSVELWAVKCVANGHLKVIADVCVLGACGEWSAGET